MAQRLLPLAVLILAAVPAFAQPARPQRPPDIAGEWNLTNNEEDTTAQPPLGDYLGIPFNAAGRQRSTRRARRQLPDGLLGRDPLVDHWRRVGR